MSTGGSAFLHAAVLLRYPLHFGALKNLNCHAQGFINGASVVKTVNSGSWAALMQGFQATVGLGLVFPMPMGNGAKVEFNVIHPIGASASSGDTQRFQLAITSDWM